MYMRFERQMPGEIRNPLYSLHHQRNPYTTVDIYKSISYYIIRAGFCKPQKRQKKLIDILINMTYTALHVYYAE